MNQRDLRIGDAERDTAARELGEHFAQGRIDSEEYAERLDRVMSAKTAGELVPAFADLPRTGAGATGRSGGSAGPSTGSGRSPRRFPELPRMPFLFKVLVAFVLVALVFSHLPLVVIALVVYVLAVRRVSRRRRRGDWNQGWHSRGYAHWH
jgi:Flp pilus assembly protein TadB